MLSNYRPKSPAQRLGLWRVTATTKDDVPVEYLVGNKEMAEGLIEDLNEGYSDVAIHDPNEPAS